MLVAFCVAPSGSAHHDGSVGEAAASAIRVVRACGRTHRTAPHRTAPHRTDARFTTIEGEWNEQTRAMGPIDAAGRVAVPRSVWATMSDDLIDRTSTLRYGDVTDFAGHHAATGLPSAYAELPPSAWRRQSGMPLSEVDAGGASAKNSGAHSMQRAIESATHAGRAEFSSSTMT
ncbi:MAG: hypothetical protein H5T78_29225 [Nocardia sp.]|nr:hypothetical protein [Nocardia sp.]